MRRLISCRLMWRSQAEVWPGRRAVRQRPGSCGLHHSQQEQEVKGEDRIIASLEEQGLDVEAVRKHGEKVEKAISDQVLDMTGSRRAPQSSMEIVVPEVPGDEVSYSVEGERIVLMPTLSGGSGRERCPGRSGAG